ncbi:super-infection exclusion protein B [Flavobacterium sp.]|uniref:super-infection exclusion protein B n=1 Tax=Flavobacterium sp. TaxID=239 RepID=UPI003341172C
MENIKTLFDLTKLPTKFFFLFSVLSGFILFAEETLLKKVHLEKLNDSNGWIIGLIFISTLGLVLVNFVMWLFKKITNRIEFFKIKKDYIKRLRNLDEYEKAVLREFYITQKSSIEVPMDDSTVVGLIRKKIIFVNQQFGNGFIMNGMDVAVSMSKYVEKNLKLEDINFKENMTEDEIHFIKSNRPKWTENYWR